MKKSRLLIFLFILIVIVLYYYSSSFLTFLGETLVVDLEPQKSEAIVVLLSGIEYYPRLIEAADLFRRGFAPTVVINGNRKTDIIREVESKGYKSCCPWYEDSLRILSLYGVPREKVIKISAEDAYDTVSEAKAVGREIIGLGMSRIILTTSKYHSRRAGFIWSKMYSDSLSIITVSAQSDPYEAGGWWRDGRQIRWVLAEYGAWVYYLWKNIMDK